MEDREAQTRLAARYVAFSPDRLNPRIKAMEYAVRGKLVLNAQNHMRALKNGESRPFSDVVLCNIGNPQSVGQSPLTFPRQVLSLCMCPSLLDNPAVVQAMPADVVARAKKILSGCHGLGAYSESKGIEIVRQSVKAYIEARDGYPSDIDDIFLTNGASEGVKTVLAMMIRDGNDGVMVPIPQYPLYSAACTAFGGTQVSYYLDESRNWSLTAEALDKAAAKAHAAGVILRCICVINPGNPTGQVMTEENIKEVIAWAAKEKVLIMADEVYQANIYDPTMKFHSFKKVLRSMPAYADKVELVSFHSTSKGVIGECGMRGGYMELVNIHPETKEQVYKTLSVNLCSNLPGQAMCELMVNEPKPGDPSYESYKAEFDKVFQSLRRRALKLVKRLNDLEDVSCNSASGAMYAFPQIELPQKWVEQCKARGVPADTQYCLDLLDATGICVVPGSGFGQVDGTYHFRTTFLPTEEKMDSVSERLAKFHAEFMGKYKERASSSSASSISSLMQQLRDPESSIQGQKGVASALWKLARNSENQHLIRKELARRTADSETDGESLRRTTEAFQPPERYTGECVSQTGATATVPAIAQYAAFSPDLINPKIRDMEYAVRGKIVLAAQNHMKALKKGEERPFPEVVLCNIGNPQSVGQVPLTFPRQVLALCTCPSMLDNEVIINALPQDAVARAKKILDSCNGLGAYSESKGIEVVRQSVKAYIEARDGYPAEVDDIFLTNGASEGVKTLLAMLIRDKRDGVMVPIPQYPLYSASCTAFGGTQVSYYLDESAGWALSTNELDKAAAKARAEGLTLRCICVINPGNPTGQVMTEENIKEVIMWAAKEGVLIMADEVYQKNVYDPDMSFHSFKKVLRSMPDYSDQVELVSFHSTSKGVIGECGMRGGYMELVNIHPETKEQVYKTLSVNLCSNIPGQIMCELMVNEPKPGDPSHESYKAEYDDVFQSLQRRAVKLVKGLNSLEGYACNSASGAMYAFPQIKLPAKWVDLCKEKGVPADTQYCLDLLDATGICVVPGSGFGQVDGTFHFRTTFLPKEDKMDGVSERLAGFHADFMRKFGTSDSTIMGG